MKRSVLLLAVLVMPAFASTIDQSFTSGGSGTLDNVIDLCCQYVAQTYTAGLTGTLAGINIDVHSTPAGLAYPLDVQIQSVAGGLPTGTILGDTTFSPSNAPLSLFITFPQLIQQIAGSQYAIVVDYLGAPLGTTGGGWTGGTGNPYSGGQNLSLLDGSWIYDGQGYDVFFQTSVNTSTTPEPSTLALMLTGAVIVFVLRRTVSTPTNS